MSNEDSRFLGRRLENTVSRGHAPLRLYTINFKNARGVFEAATTRLPQLGEAVGQFGQLFFALAELLALFLHYRSRSLSSKRFI